MAFESFLTQGNQGPKTWRRITFGVSVAVHALALLGGLVYSFWHVDELSPPTVTVTFMSAPPPPPPPPPPKRRSSSSKTKPKTPTEIVQPKPDQVYQPKQKEEPKEEPPDDDDGDDNGVEGGVKGGVVGGVVGGTVGAVPKAAAVAEPPKLLPPTVAAQQALFKPDPPVPAVLLSSRPAGVFTMAKVCVDKEGMVNDVKIVKPGEPLWDRSVADTLKTWKFRPTMVNGNPVPFCFIARVNLAIR